MKKREPICGSCRKTSIGGQALIEGIMMRGPQKSAIAVRRPNGEIFFDEEENKVSKRPKICRVPFIRGFFNFIDSMVLGYRYLMRSAEIACEEEPDAEQKKKAAEAGENGEAKVAPAPEPAPAEIPHDEALKEEKSPTKAEEGKASAKEKKEKKESSRFMTVLMIVATVLGFSLAIILFVWLPSKLFSLLQPHLPAAIANNQLIYSLAEGVIKIAVLVSYMALVSFMKDIHRTFMYHGAEHKTIFCYERGLPLTVENVRKQRRFHPRCGTSFLILMLIVSVLVGAFIPTHVEGLSPALYRVLRVAIKILLIPIIMGIGYELLKFAGRHDNILTRIISAPGMWLQRITVKEPTDDMIECAIKAFEAVVPPDDTDKW